jgi:hypothetical protein
VALGFDTGSLKCNRTCDAVDSTGCAHVPPSTAVCGDGVKEGDEKCDFLDFGGATCASSGFDGGELICSYDCRKISTPLCTTICGDGIRKGAELCDGEAFKDTDYRKCTRFGYDSGSVSCNKSCNGYDLSACSKCGDLVLEGNEACEANDHGGRTCESLGFIGGTLACDDCRLITNGCTTRCGDGLAQGYEVCDAPDLKGRTCESGGYDSGTLGCQANCIQFDYSGCRSTCGNGVTGPREVCDGTDVNGSCRQEGFDGGRIACNATCSGYDTTACTTCGNGLLEPGEVCDGEDLGGWTCRLFGYSGGTLRCAACTGFDESGCTAN